MRMHDGLAKPLVAKVLDEPNISRIGLGSWNDFQQPHVAWRIEEVRAEPVLSQIVGHPFDNLCNRKTAGVTRNDRTGATVLLQFVEQCSLDLKILRDNFNDPVTVRDEREIVVEVAERNQTSVLRDEERGGL